MKQLTVILLPAVLLAAVFLMAGPALGTEESDRYVQARERMVRSQIAARGVKDSRVLAAMDSVPRHMFVPDQHLDRAYEDHPLPIGLGQTISQPYIVAFMTELLELGPDDRVFELGTGSGYQAAVASRVAGAVYTVEIYEALADAAARKLDSLGYSNVHVRNGDGYFGWDEAAPFDAIIVTAAADHIPPPLIEQLKPGGRLIIPLGNPFTVQQLVLVTRDSEGQVTERPIIPVRFVPLLGH
jgi:protein-L-isoaspartate(D-aspartate) O-methyltransferase